MIFLEINSIILQFLPKPLQPTYSTYLIIYPSWMPSPILQLDYTDHLLFEDLDLDCFCEKIFFFKKTNFWIPRDNFFCEIFFYLASVHQKSTFQQPWPSSSMVDHSNPNLPYSHRPSHQKQWCFHTCLNINFF